MNCGPSCENDFYFEIKVVTVVNLLTKLNRKLGFLKTETTHVLKLRQKHGGSSVLEVAPENSQGPTSPWGPRSVTFQQ